MAKLHFLQLFLILIVFVLSIVSISTTWFEFDYSTNGVDLKVNANINELVISQSNSYSDKSYNYDNCNKVLRFTDNDDNKKVTNFCNSMKANFGICIVSIIISSLTFIATIFPTNIVYKIVYYKYKGWLVTAVLLWIIAIAFIVSSAVAMSQWNDLENLVENLTNWGAKWSFEAGSICGLIAAIFALIAGFAMLTLKNVKEDETLLS